jgi:DNA primase
MEHPDNIPAFINNQTLNDIRRNADWRATFQALGLQRDEKASREKDWWCSSPLSPDDKTASFHMNADPKGGGHWHCFSTGQGGGLPDLIQQLHGGNIYEAGRWLLEHGCSHLHGAQQPRTTKPSAIAAATDPTGKSNPSGEKEKEAQAPNKPIRQTLLPALTQQGTHAEFQRRGISADTCQYLGCGYLPATHKSSLKDRLVFQIRGLDDLEAVSPNPTILTHMGRALSDEQAAQDGKWSYYKGFKKSLELYNLDQLRLDPEAQQQITDTGHLILVEGCFDVAACIEAGIRNVAASFGTQVSAEQIEKLHSLKEVLQVKLVLVWYDRDKAGQSAQSKLITQLEAEGIPAQGFDWQQTFTSPVRGDVPLPETVTDPGEFSTQQINWLRSKGKI